MAKTLAQIKLQIEASGIIKRMAHFESYDPPVFTYAFKYDRLGFKFKIIANGKLQARMPIGELLELKNIEYFCFNTFIQQAHGRDKVTCSMEYKQLLTEQNN